MAGFGVFLMTCCTVLALHLGYLGSVQGQPQIVAPYPNNVYVIEGEKTQITCVAADDDPSAKPDKIVFVRKTRFGDTTLILDQGPDGRVYYENKTLDGGKKLSVTLYLRQVTKQDGSSNGGYECQGYTNTTSREYGFTVTVIGRDELPGIQVSDNVTAEFGDKIVLSCNLTMNTGGMTDQTKLSNLKWIKDGVVIDEVLYPREQSLKSRVIEINAPEDGGMYSCQLTSKLRSFKDYNISDSIVVTVKAKLFVANKTVFVTKPGESVSVVCSAQGNPLKTVWKRHAYNNVTTVNDQGSKMKYDFSNLDKLKNHTLTIHKVQLTDLGEYYCCIREMTNPRKPEDINGCERFTVQLQGAAGRLFALSPLIISTLWIAQLLLL